MIGAHQAREAVRRQAPLPKVLQGQGREVADREIDLPFLQVVSELRSRHRHGADGTVRRLRSDLFEDSWQERHLADVRQRQRDGARA